MILRADTLERKLLMDATLEAYKYQQARDEWMARKIIAELSDALKKGRRR